MLSIGIPVYNVNITTLIRELVQQGIQNSVTLEILVYDDGSITEIKKINKQISSLKGVTYFELTQNLGSAAIRNKLAADALYQNILFIDSDSGLYTDFLKNYIPWINSEELIVYGGRVHPQKLPSRDKSLRWKVGKKKEDHSADFRQRVPNKSFMSNNFLVKKELFSMITFDETIARSGHEDTMFGIELEKKNIRIIHINNPVIHLGLEENQEFIFKTEQRLNTLHYLESIHHNNSLLYERITILRYVNMLRKLKLMGIVNTMFKLSKNYLIKCLLLKNPSMLIYDVYKLGYYTSLLKTKQ
jgi:glycosyltransferase involved in cell wall biosynthesis